MHTVEMTRALREIVIAAGREIMAIYDSGEAQTRLKADASPVTAADLAADRVICDGLAAAFPSISVVTEEQADSHAAAATSHFLVDPLDGTKEFIDRRGEFTVNVALIENGVPVAGLVYAPAIGRLFRTAPGGGAVEETGSFALAVEGPTRSLAVASADNAALRVIASKSHRDAATDAYIARYKVSAFKSAGSSLKFCLIASGEADLYPRLGRTMEWDTAAGHAVLAAAGGVVVRFDDGAPLTYGKQGKDNPHFIAAGAGVAFVPAGRS